MQKHTGLDFTYGFKTRQFVGIAKVPNLSHYTMVLNLQRVTENDNMILLQNEVFFIMRLLEGETPLLQNEDWIYHQIT